MVYSSTSVRAAAQEQDGAYFLKRQVAWAGIGLLAMVAAMRIPLEFWRRNARPMMLVVAVLLVGVLLFGTKINGARRWFRVAGLSLQPSEIAKLVLLVFVPISWPIGYLVVNGWLLGREYFELVALRRISPAAAKTMRNRRRPELLLTGIGLTFLFTLPLVNQFIELRRRNLL